MSPQEFLDKMAETANKHDFTAHMNLISKDVKVYGIPNYEVISYDDWFNQCKKEFEDKFLLGISYHGLQILAEVPNRVQCIAIEMAKAKDGHENAYCIEFTIQKESDDQWRVVEERILPEAELESDETDKTLQ